MTDLIEVKTSDLIGKPLDWAVAKAGNRDVLTHQVDGLLYVKTEQIVVRRHRAIALLRWEPSRDWLQGGPLMENHAIAVIPLSDAEWQAEEYVTHCKARSTSYLVAAMRCLVLAELGKTIQVPKELLS